MNDHLESMQINHEMWEEKTPVHIKSYKSIGKLRNGEQILDEIELQEIGDVKGKKLLHLMCHLGTDTLGWAKEGAEVTGIDFSESAIDFARSFAQELGLKARFIHSNLYELEKVLDEKFDIIYTSQGVLCWLCDLKEWGRLISGFLKPGGVFYILESHPMVSIFNDMNPGKPLEIQYSYFHKEDPIIFNDDKPDYSDQTFTSEKPSHEWNWSLSDIINSLIDHGLKIEFLHEYDKLFYQHTEDMIPVGNGWYQFAQNPGMIPLSFSIRAIKE